jgi:hypothetical protein
MTFPREVNIKKMPNEIAESVEIVPKMYAVIDHRETSL